MLHDTTDTIAALCTPPGASARAIVRLSGEQCFPLVDRLFSPHPGQPRTGSAARSPRGVWRGTLQLALPGGNVPCPALLYRMPAPASYTRQDVAELLLPGSPPLIDALLRQLSALGARQAQPGEFTLRAFLSGRIGLTQAEAVEQIVRAETEAARKAALARLDLDQHRRLGVWKQTLREVAGLLEATLDFEEEELEPEVERSLQARLNGLAAECQALAGQAALCDSDGIRLLLAGPTNAGKSALLNRLLGREAAIVSPERSTTRDRTVHPLQLGRYALRLEDCPGVDAGAHPLARSVSDHALAHYAAAPLLLLVVDAQAGATPELQAFLRSLPVSRAVLVCNKCDQSLRLAAPACVEPQRRYFSDEILQCIRGYKHITLLASCPCSARDGFGIDRLRSLLSDLVRSEAAVDASGSLSRREAAELAEAARACTAAAHILPEAPELAASELRLAYEAVHRATGGGYAEEILAGIFSRFCIGK